MSDTETRKYRNTEIDTKHINNFIKIKHFTL